MNLRPSFDATIPVLTEVFQDLPAKVGADAKAAETDLAMAALERRLCERIVQQLQGRIDGMLEQCLRDSMEPALQQALQHALQQTVAGLSDALHTSAQQSIKDIVARAVAQEWTHLHTLNT